MCLSTGAEYVPGPGASLPSRPSNRAEWPPIEYAGPPHVLLSTGALYAPGPGASLPWRPSKRADWPPIENAGPPQVLLSTEAEYVPGPGASLPSRPSNRGDLPPIEYAGPPQVLISAAMQNTGSREVGCMQGRRITRDQRNGWKRQGTYSRRRKSPGQAQPRASRHQLACR